MCLQQGGPKSSVNKGGPKKQATKFSKKKIQASTTQASASHVPQPDQTVTHIPNQTTSHVSEQAARYAPEYEPLASHVP